ncbi:MAG: hypothetical protein EI684_20130 [Candidatus Viridilinea halotolerans]|uniref:Transposase n=1 Tax=Candidatus Viridilinea halotolerans TaxID=2491704 RepID=A0A426TS68_9CHLR|nr:MAG: hypothetical protein EI684_20130 [Candidatus Viridilinea halotolerans]
MVQQKPTEGHAQTEVPVVPILLSDDAAAYDRVTTTHALCWVHEWRLYTKLHPQIPHHQGLLEPFRKDYWALYRRLLAYRAAPSAAERARLHDAFDTLNGNAPRHTWADPVIMERTRHRLLPATPNRS